MGLDMYLERHYYVQNWDHNPPEQQYEVTVMRGGKPYAISGKTTYVISEIAYWRKANAIHNWFVQHCADGVDDCNPIYVGPDGLRSLLEDVRKVRAKPSLAPKLLPTTAGFFFGSTDYGEDYMQDLIDTEKIIESALADEGGDVYYHASW
jgi:hypothetical protein